jgi:hypothetical protein
VSDQLGDERSGVEANQCRLEPVRSIHAVKKSGSLDVHIAFPSFQQIFDPEQMIEERPSRMRNLARTGLDQKRDLLFM